MHSDRKGVLMSEVMLLDKTIDRKYLRSGDWWRNPTNRAWWTAQIELGPRAHLSALWAGEFSVEEDQAETIGYAMKYRR
jgi:hypothetical protein